MNNSELGHPLKNDQYNNPCSKNDHDISIHMIKIGDSGLI